SNSDMLASPAEWISLCGRSDNTYKTIVADAPVTKVSILDTDHTWGIDPAANDSPWVWKSLLRGHNPIYMDPYGVVAGSPPDLALRNAMGYARTLPSRINLNAMSPSDGTASTGYVLANPNTEYLVYQPSNTSFTVTLPARTFNFCGINPSTGQVTQTGTISAKNGSNSFTLPTGYTSGLLHVSTSPLPTA